MKTDTDLYNGTLSTKVVLGLITVIYIIKSNCYVYFPISTSYYLELDPQTSLVCKKDLDAQHKFFVPLSFV